MSSSPRNLDKRHSFSDYGQSDQEDSRSPKCGSSPTDRRVRREIANSNERRRMQSINSGFQLLRSLIPRSDGEKLSKAGILQQTADYIRTLQAEKSKLHLQVQQLKRYVTSLERPESDSSSASRSPPPKRRKRDTESSDEGISMSYEDAGAIDELRKEMVDIRRQLQQERCLRAILEERMKPEEARAGTAPAPTPPRPAPTNASVKLPSSKTEPIAVSRSSQRPPISPRIREESSMSRRNLETIVEAIRHLEGEKAWSDDKKESMDDSDAGSESPCYHRELSPIATTAPSLPMAFAMSGNMIPVQLFRPNIMTEHCLRKAVIMQAQTQSS